MCTKFIAVSFIIFLSHNVNSVNILGLFPHPGRSHQMFFEPLLKRLSQKGHNMTVASFFPMKDPLPNYRDVSFQGIANMRLESYDLEAFENENIFYKFPILGSVAKQIISLSTYAVASTTICERLTNFQPLFDVLKNDYDLVIVENFTSDCILGLLYVYGITAPIVALVSGNHLPWTLERVGAVDNPSYVPVITTSLSAQMSFIERLENTLSNFAMNNWYNNDVLLKEKMIIEKKFGNIPDLRELGKNVSAIFVNSFYVLNGVKPLVPGLVETGGLHLSTERKPLPQFIEKFLNESENGVILFSFGSHIRTMSLPKYKEQIFLNVLTKLKQRIIWKYEDSGEEGTYFSNILKVKWIPQYELLQHEKVVAFISHGGMLGLTEAVASGKPTVVIPFFADQHHNAAAASTAGIAKLVSYKHLTEESLSSALQAVLSEEMVAKTRTVSKMWCDRESTPLDTAMYHIERTIRWGHDAKLYSTARNLSFYQLSLIDVAITIAVTVLLFASSVIYLIIKVFKVLRKKIKVKLH